MNNNSNEYINVLKYHITIESNCSGDMKPPCIATAAAYCDANRCEQLDCVSCESVIHIYMKYNLL